MWNRSDIDDGVETDHMLGCLGVIALCVVLAIIAVVVLFIMV